MALTKVSYSMIQGEVLNVLDYGVVGDGTTDNTTALQAAQDAAIASKKSLYFPVGIYLTDTINWGIGNGKDISWFGESSTNSIIKKKSSDGTALVVVGSSSQSAYVNNISISNLTFQGISGNTTASLQLVDVVRSKFTGCIFTNSLIGVESQGGISNTFNECSFDGNAIGIKLTIVAGLTPPAHSPCGGGYPNNNTLSSCLIANNTSQGIYFDYGAVLNVNDCDIEGNGTSGNAATSGVYVGANIGVEAGVVVTGVNISNSWLEQNAGDSAINLLSGFNNINNNFIVANPNATYDIHIVGQRYNLIGNYLATNKLTNIKEESTVSNGNYIINTRFNGIAYDVNKTVLQFRNEIAMRGGSVPIVTNYSRPLIQTGNDQTSANPTITFEKPYISLPRIICQGANSSASITGPEIYDVTTTGFKIRKNYFNGSIITTTNYYVDWIAIGGE